MEQTLKANELRIGNLVYDLGYAYDDEGNLCYDDSKEIIEITSTELVDLQQGDFFCEPIPLTEECLLKFGFVLDEEDDGYQRGKYKVSVSEEGCLFFVYFDYYMQELCEFNYIHQLQNLYFALSGQELTFKQQ